MRLSIRSMQRLNRELSRDRGCQIGAASRWVSKALSLRNTLQAMRASLLASATASLFLCKRCDAVHLSVVVWLSPSAAVRLEGYVVFSLRAVLESNARRAISKIMTPPAG